MHKDTDTLKQQQQIGTGPLATMYDIVERNVELDQEAIHTAGTELKKLYSRRNPMAIDQQGIMRIQIHVTDRNGIKSTSVAIAPLYIRKELILQCHNMRHAGTELWPG